MNTPPRKGVAIPVGIEERSMTAWAPEKLKTQSDHQKTNHQSWTETPERYSSQREAVKNGCQSGDNGNPSQPNAVEPPKPTPVISPGKLKL